MGQTSVNSRQDIQSRQGLAEPRRSPPPTRRPTCVTLTSRYRIGSTTAAACMCRADMHHAWPLSRQGQAEVVNFISCSAPPSGFPSNDRSRNAAFTTGSCEATTAPVRAARPSDAHRPLVEGDVPHRRGLFLDPGLSAQHRASSPRARCRRSRRSCSCCSRCSARCRCTTASRR